MKRKTFALLLSAMLAVQPVSVVLAEDMLSSGTESTEIIQETEPQAATLTDDMFTDAGENSPNLVGGGY